MKIKIRKEGEQSYVEKLKNGELEDMEIELDIETINLGVGFIGVPDMKI